MTKATMRLIALLTLPMLASACAQKKFVRADVEEANRKVDTISRMLEETQERIRANEARIAEVEQYVVEAEKRAVAAELKASEAALAFETAMARSAKVTAAVNGPTEVVLTEDAGGFEPGRAELGERTQALLDDLIEQLKMDPAGAFLEIEGHTDGTAGREANQSLGDQRARAVQRYLYDRHQIALHRMSVINRGASQPLASNVTSAGRALNRRVSVRILSTTSVDIAPRQRPIPPPPLRWNAWAESALGRAANFRPTELRPSSHYRIVLDLSARSYSPKVTERSVRGGPTVATVEYAGGVATVAVPLPVGEEMGSWLNETDAPTGNIQIMLVPHPAFFGAPAAEAADWYQDVVLDLNKMRAAARERTADSQGGDAFLDLKKGDDPSWLFGRGVFHVQTKRALGLAPLAFVIWKDGRPLDEFVVRFCVSTLESNGLCASNHPITLDYALSGVDSLRFGNQKAAVPTAALHFVNFGPNVKIRAVFKRNDGASRSFVSWSLKETFEGLVRSLSNMQLKAVEEAVDDDELESHGESLFDTLFPDDEREGSDARAAFSNFLRDYRSTGERPSLFVRLVDRSDQPMPFIPLGLAVVDRKFLGFQLRIETPLPSQWYASPAACVSSWAGLIPPTNADTTLDIALTHLQDGWLPSFKPERDITNFRTWLRSSETASSPLALITLSHHANNSLFFQSPGPRVTAANVRRRFDRASVAILNGCGTGGPGGEQFLRTLNENGVSGVIATNITVSGDMAGKFLSCLGKVLGDKRDTGIRLGDAYALAIDCLREEAPVPGGRKYGARALTYSFLGNGDISLCVPPVPETEVK